MARPRTPQPPIVLRAARLLDVDDRGRLAPGLFADVIAVAGDPLADITTTERVAFVMKGGTVYRQPA